MDSASAIAHKSVADAPSREANGLDTLIFRACLGRPTNKAFALVTVLIVLSPLGLVAVMSHPNPMAAGGDTLYQVSTLDALLSGDYHGKKSIGELRSHGDIGLGTFDALDGEMIVIDGVVYRAAYDGTVGVVPDNGSTPFASVIYFEIDKTLAVSAGSNFSELSAALLTAMDSRSFYVIEISGVFPEVTVRSVPRQTEPYIPLADVLPLQSVRILTNVSGTLVGIYSPPYIGTMDSPGFHLHFISDDRTSGGSRPRARDHVRSGRAGPDYGSRGDLT